MLLFAIISILSLSVVWLLKSWWTTEKNPHGLRYPPGPKPKPLIGNLLDLPKSEQWVTVSKWQKIYGNIIHAKVLRKDYVFLNDFDATIELFEKRSSIYSDRPRLVMLREVIGYMWATPFQPYGDEWRQYRREYHQLFNSRAVEPYHVPQMRSYRSMVANIVDSPKDFLHYTYRAAARNMIHVGYGIDEADCDRFIPLAEQAIEHVNKGGEAGEFLVEELPELLYIPEWFPGAGWKKLGNSWRKSSERYINEPFLVAKELIRLGRSSNSAISRILQSEDKKDLAEKERMAKWVSLTTFIAGMNSTVSILQSFFLAMALYPSVQLKAQNEIDSVMDHNHLPDHSDKLKLPYVEALLKEVMRWHPTTPFAIPHATTQDDEYKGYFIRKGTIVIANVWHMLQDEAVYPQPSVFKPERFLDSEGKLDPAVRQPERVAFGFGRRICPGRHLAMDSLFFAIVTILATLKIEPAVDDKGNPIPLKPEFIPGLVSTVKPFECAIRPRSEQRMKLLRDWLSESNVTA